MKRREFITLLGGAAAAWPLVASSQEAAKVPRIGLLGCFGLKRPGSTLRAGLRDLGYMQLRP
jgi:putative tryptophan/tyrosine transport system substrate-binding protein